MNTCYPIDQNRKYTFSGKIVYSPEEKAWWAKGQGFIAPTESHKRLRLPSQDPYPTMDAEFFTQFHCSSHDEALAEIEKQIKATTLAIRLHGQKRQVCFDNCVVNLEFWRMHPGMSDIGVRIEVLLEGKQVAAPEKTTVGALREAARAWSDQHGFHRVMFAKIDALLAAEQASMPRCPNTYYSTEAAQ